MSEVSVEVVVREPKAGEYGYYYRHGFCCGNCGKHQYAYVRKGTSLANKGIDCDNCGCYERFRTSQENWSDK